MLGTSTTEQKKGYGTRRPTTQYFNNFNTTRSIGVIKKTHNFFAHFFCTVIGQNRIYSFCPLFPVRLFSNSFAIRKQFGCGGRLHTTCRLQRHNVKRLFVLFFLIFLFKVFESSRFRFRFLFSINMVFYMTC